MLVGNPSLSRHPHTTPHPDPFGDDHSSKTVPASKKDARQRAGREGRGRKGEGTKDETGNNETVVSPTNTT